MSRIHDQLSQSISTPPRTPIEPRVAAPPSASPPAVAPLPAAAPAVARPAPAAASAAATVPAAPLPEPQGPSAAPPRHPGLHRVATPRRPIYTPSTELKSPPLGGMKAIVAFAAVAVILMVTIAHHILAGGDDVAVRVAAPGPEARSAAPAPEPVPAPPEAAMAEPQSAPAAPPAPAPAPVVAAVSRTEPVPVAPTWPEVDIAGARIAREGQSLEVVFDYGLFARVDQLRPEARDALAEFASQVRPHLDRFSVVVTGFTDDDPVPANRPYRTNYELGMMRAMAATKALVDSGIPPGSIATRSLGDQETPYPNDTQQNKARNRTATISLRAAAP